MNTKEAINLIENERERQKTLTFNGVPSEKWDRTNNIDNWVSYITTYVGKCGTAAVNNNENIIRNLVKVGALAIAALENLG